MLILLPLVIHMLLLWLFSTFFLRCLLFSWLFAISFTACAATDYPWCFTVDFFINSLLTSHYYSRLLTRLYCCCYCYIVWWLILMLMFLLPATVYFSVLTPPEMHTVKYISTPQYCNRIVFSAPVLTLHLWCLFVLLFPGCRCSLGTSLCLFLMIVWCRIIIYLWCSIFYHCCFCPWYFNTFEPDRRR